LITLKDIRLNNSQNKTFLSFDGQLEFKENTVYFIIGLSGIGKTSLIEFLTAPFTDDPIKNGNIILSPDIGLQSFVGGKKLTNLPVKNSHNLYFREYVNFIRKSVALIPQKTDSFHPSIPIVDQMYENYKTACFHVKKSDWEHKKDFSEFLEKYGTCAGWDKISVDPAWLKKPTLKSKVKQILTKETKDINVLKVEDKKNYIENSSNNSYEIVNLSREKVFEGEFSTGQLQRILILLGLMRFHASEHPILIGDEFLVNFTYPEANKVLENILTFFKDDERKSKIGIFILHDLSFDALRTIQEKDLSVRLIALEKDEKHHSSNSGYSSRCKQRRLKTETPDMQKLVAHEMALVDFFKGNWKDEYEKEVFEKFKVSYEALPIKNCTIDTKQVEDITPHRIFFDTSRPNKDVYNNIDLVIGIKRFVVLTGFSGCGKTTLCNQYLKECEIKDKKSIRYFPSRSMSFLSEDSQISIKQDLSIMYDFYNEITSLNDCTDEIKKMLENVCFYDTMQTISDDILKEFFGKKIYDLSGGQQQRYWLLRILFDFWKDKEDYIQPDLLILDESIASLDCITKDKIIALLLEQVLSNRGMSVLFVSHDLRDISVIYKTILANVGEDNIHQYFEHYEMFHKGLYKVLTPFPEYKENFKDRKANRYLSVKDNTELLLRFDATTASGIMNGGRK